MVGIGLFEAMPVIGDTEIIHRLRERHPVAVVRRCCRMQGYGLGRWLAVWGILALGYGAFLAGRLTYFVVINSTPRLSAGTRPEFLSWRITRTRG